MLQVRVLRAVQPWVSVSLSLIVFLVHCHWLIYLGSHMYGHALRVIRVRA